jgi:very-short-patch-repair endonuclease
LLADALRRGFERKSPSQILGFGDSKKGIKKHSFMKIPFAPYNKKLKTISRTLRKNSTLSEVILWNELKGGKMKGYIFNRQKPIKNYVVDFYCRKRNLVIEIDGCTHNVKQEEDVLRQSSIEDEGIKFLRFDDQRIKHDLVNVLAEIEKYLEDKLKNQPC